MTATPSSPPAALTLAGVSRSFGRRGQRVHALRDVSLTVLPATVTAVMGASGSGKSTLLQCAAGLDRVDSGRITVAGQEVTAAGRRQLDRFRRESVGFVFQAYNLLPMLTAAQNVALTRRLSRRRVRGRDVEAVLARVGLEGLGRRRPVELSGGQQQRVAIARALLSEPPVLFADEPTGALDSASGRQVLGLLREQTGAGRTVVLVTHDAAVAATADVVVMMSDGRVREELVRPDLAAVNASTERLVGAAPEAGQDPQPRQDPRS